jgi:hypothetical protein
MTGKLKQAGKVGVVRRNGKRAGTPGSAAGDEPLEPRISAERRERRVHLEPAGREVIRHLEQRLELVAARLKAAGM